MMKNRCLQGIAALLCALALSGPATAAGPQRTFASPEMAVEALVDGVARNDGAEVRAILGIKSDKLVPLDSVSLDDRLAFLAAWAQGHRIVNDGDKVARLELSTGWTLPIPLTRTSQGWVFDTEAGKAEVRIRRIGRTNWLPSKPCAPWSMRSGNTPSRIATVTAYANSHKKSSAPPASMTDSTGQRPTANRKARPAPCWTPRI